MTVDIIPITYQVCQKCIGCWDSFEKVDYVCIFLPFGKLSSIVIVGYCEKRTQLIIATSQQHHRHSCHMDHINNQGVTNNAKPFLVAESNLELAGHSHCVCKSISQSNFSISSMMSHLSPSLDSSAYLDVLHVHLNTSNNQYRAFWHCQVQFLLYCKVGINTCCICCNMKINLKCRHVCTNLVAQFLLHIIYYNFFL